MLAVSFSSQKYAHRAPEGTVLLRAFVGGTAFEFPALDIEAVHVAQEGIDVARLGHDVMVDVDARVAIH